MNMLKYSNWYLITAVLFKSAITNGQTTVGDAILEQLANFTCGVKWECPLTAGIYLPCACDSLCQIAGDCCQGRFEINNLPQVNAEDFECASSPLVEDDILMITKCPPDWIGGRIKELCESSPMIGSDEFQTIHVSGSESGFMYKNQYCAKCHSEPYKFWRPTIGCNDSFIFPNDPKKNFKMSELLKSTSHCTISKLTPPDGAFIRKCPESNSLVDTCPPSWQDSRFKKLCEEAKGIQPVYYIDEIRIKNIYCGYCGIPDISKFQCPDLRSETRTVAFYPFSILFDINKIEKDEEKVIVCSKNQVYDPFANICRDALCSRNMVFKNGQCVFSGIISDGVANLDCPHIILDESEFEISDAGELVVLNSNYVYNPEFFEILEDNTVAVCSNFTQNYTSTELEYHFDDIQTILSVIGITLSIIGCVLTICVYLGFKTLRNIPGKIVISLCISLILAYLTMLIGPTLKANFVGCKSFAIMMHFFFLVAFFWMNVMAIDVWYTFAYHQAGGSSERSTRFRFYVVYVFFMAAIPVILSTILDEIGVTEEFSPHYGEGLCWFTRRNALLVFFGLPSLLVLVTNVILFLIAAKTIYSAQRNSVRLLGKEDKSMLSIYVRLTIVMGVAYLFGILVPLFNHPAVLYIFIILNTLQGLFIFVSFVCTRKVLGLLREKANIWSQNRSDSSFSGSRSTTKSTAVSFKPAAGKFH